jgi:trans-aconitate methyltransferase
MNYEKVKHFWENCKGNYAHIRQNWSWFTNKKRTMFFEKCFDVAEFENKIVCDYGCGGGFLGPYLFETHNIKKYIGVDISKRSRQHATINNKGFNSEFYGIDIQFKDIEIDIFITISTIQHFPDKEYLDSFLLNLNGSGIEVIFLQYRYNDKTVFNKAYEEAENNKAIACRTNDKYIQEKLSNYEVIKIVNDGSELKSSQVMVLRSKK